MQPLETCTLTIGVGMLMTPSKEVIGLETKTQSTTCAKKHLMLSMSFSLTAFLFQETKKERSTKELLAGSLESTEKVNEA